MCRYLIMLCVPILAFAGRAPSWRNDRDLGSEQLRMSAIEYLVLPCDAGDTLLTAVEDLKELMQLRYDVSLEVRDMPLGTSPKNSIVLRRNRLPWDRLNIHRERTRVFVEAATDEGFVNGIYTLCRDVLGARWYWPGELGLEFVGEPMRLFPERRWDQAPAFIQRGVPGQAGVFQTRNRLVQDYDFSHALATIFTPELYEQEPDVFPLIDGVRKAPKGSRSRGAQPDFTNPRTVEIAADAVRSYFEAYPERTSISLSLNDTMKFDESAATQAVVEPLQYFRGRPNYTELVFRFMNAVAEQVFEEDALLWTTDGRPRYLTQLAYYWTEQSPEFQLHPRVMPILTSDRAQWHDPAYRAEDQALIRRWCDSGAERVATWDYYYGPAYPYPRQFSQWMAESLRYMSEQGVTAFHAKLPASWGLDGPKAWLMAQLLWDPTEDVNDLLSEFYANFFGAAAEPMQAFYELAELQRNEYEGEAGWIKFFQNEAGIALFSEATLRAMREQLEAAALLVEADTRRLERVQVVSDAFRLTEHYAAYQGARVGMLNVSLAVLNDRGEADELPSLVARFVTARSEFKHYAAALIQQPMHRRLNDFVKLPQSDPLPVALAALAHSGVISAVEVPSEYQQVADVALELEAAGEAFVSMRSNPSLSSKGQTLNPRKFPGPALPSVSGWHFKVRPSEHFVVDRIDDGAGVRISGADYCVMGSVFPVIGEKSYVLDFEAEYSVSGDCRIQVQLLWSDIAGHQFQADIPLMFPAGQSDGFTRVVIPIAAPVGAYDLRINFWNYRQSKDDFIELHSVDFGLVGRPMGK
ncbi:DUF4838 domain-containing protein [Lentimonas sp. CC21]|uniref:DUF4838 domain-containing protein n=2 Tax=Lentimonas TaxID=417293 RepID=UPI001A7EF2EE|nr:DUF4838 domain-containing protein [Lentimonas sp. CC21]